MTWTWLGKVRDPVEIPVVPPYAISVTYEEQYGDKLFPVSEVAVNPLELCPVDTTAL